MTERTRRVVLLIDYDNLQICAARDTPGRDLQLVPVVQLAQRFGTVILARAYAEWNLSTERLAVYKAGIEPAFAPVLRTESDRSGKSLADTVMVAEGMDMLWTLSPEVVVLATSDKDLIPLVRVAKQRGAFVVVLGSDFTAIPLREMADEHVTYRQLITEAGVRYATEGGPGRTPAALPEPSRRRRERNGRERSPMPPPPASTPPATSTGVQPRPEREQTPSPAPVAAGVPAGTEPVAPITAPAPGEADMQGSGRRRRRRGSRRRSDRLGLGPDATSTVAEGFGAGSELGEDDSDVFETEPDTFGEDITPTTPAAESEPVPESAEVVSETAAPEPALSDAVAAPAERRRRTRRRVAESPEAAPSASDEPEQAGSAPATSATLGAELLGTPLPASASDAPEQSADIEPAPPPEAVSPNGDAQITSPAPRRRRVASASRGRSRRP